MKNNGIKSEGFTLIELLVVISIIAVLMSIMMPALGKARDVAKNAICRSNIKNLGTASLLWTEDNDKWALPALWDRDYNGQTILKPYLGDADTGDKVMLCPSVPAKYAGKTYDELNLTNDVAGLALNGKNYYNSYGYNFKLCSDTNQCPGTLDKNNDNNTQWGVDAVWYDTHGNCKLFSVRKPSTTIMFGDSIMYLSYPEFYTKPMLNPAFKDPAARGRRHNSKKRHVGTSDTELCGKMNIAWVDGSVSPEPDDLDVISADGRKYNISGKYWYGN